jgi:hypothetical protein
MALLHTREMNLTSLMRIQFLGPPLGPCVVPLSVGRLVGSSGNTKYRLPSSLVFDVAHEPSCPSIHRVDLHEPDAAAASPI